MDDIVEACRRDGMCWKVGDLRTSPTDVAEHRDYWSIHGDALWRGCIKYAVFDPDTGALIVLRQFV